MSLSALRNVVVVVAVLSLFLLFGVAVQLVVSSYLCSHPPVKIPQANRNAFARVAILLDGTGSVGADNFQLAKKVIEKQILPSLGYGDVAVAYDVQPAFSPLTNEVFGLSQAPMPGAEERTEVLTVLGPARAGGPGPHAVDETMYDLIRRMETQIGPVSAVRADWKAGVEARRSPPDPGSEICAALNEIGRWLAQKDAATEPWLFALTDLQQTGSTQSCHPALIPGGTRIFLIYSPRAQPAASFWQPIFDQRNVQWVPLSAVAGSRLLPPNPLAEIETHHIPTLRACVAARLAPAGLAGGALLAAMWLLVLALALRDRGRRRRGSDTSGA